MDNDDYFDDGFVGYIETTVDPGPWILFGTTVYCALTILALPVLVILWRRKQRRKVELESHFQFIDAISSVDKQSNHELQHDSSPHGKRHQINDSSRSESIAILHSKSDDSIELKRVLDKSQIKEADNSSDFSSSTGSALVKLALVTNSVNKAVDQLTQNSPTSSKKFHHKTLNQSHDMRSIGSRSIDSSVSSVLSRGLRPFSRSTRSTNLSNRSHGIHKVLYHEKREERQFMIEKKFDSSNTNDIETLTQKSHFSTSRQYPTNNQFLPSQANSICIVSEIYPEEAVDANDPGKKDTNMINDYKEYDICCGSNPCWSPMVLRQALFDLVEIAEYDNESMRLVKLAVPMTIAEVVSSIYRNIQLALIARGISTDAVAAFAISGLFIQLTDTFVKVRL